MKNNELKLMKLLKRILISTEVAHHMKNTKKILMDLLEKGFLNFII